MTAARWMLPLGAALMLGACVSGAVPGPAAIVMPGPGKDFAAIQQDDTICRRHAAANTGYGDLALPRTQGSNAAISGMTGKAGTARTAGTTNGVGTPAGAGTTGGVGSAAGVPAGSGAIAANVSGASAPEPPDETVPNQLEYLQCMAARGDTVSAEPAGYAEAPNWYWYGYPYGFYDGGVIVVFGGGFHGRNFHRRFFHDGGFHRGFAHAGGFHHGGFHGGGFHGGGSHRGGGHR